MQPMKATIIIIGSDGASDKDQDRGNGKKEICNAFPMKDEQNASIEQDKDHETG